MKKGHQIHERDDVRPDEGVQKYGNVVFADPTNNKYPIDTPEHVRTAWSYINHEANAAKYTADEVNQIKRRIKNAANEQGVSIHTD